jgi:protein-disulfide isomerase
MSTLRVPVSPDDHILGPADAPVTLVEYGDYECPYCGMAQPVVRQLLEGFGRDLRLVFRHFPLTEVHPNAATAAETAEFADDHGRFWEMHDALYANQPRLGYHLYYALAGRLGLSQDGLRESLTHGLHAAKIRSDFLGGVRSGVNGTPSFFVNGVRHDGSYAYDELAQSIELARRAALLTSRSFPTGDDPAHP